MTREPADLGKDEVAAEEELALLRTQVRRIGFSELLDPADFGIESESPAEMLERLRGVETACGPPAGDRLGGHLEEDEPER